MNKRVLIGGLILGVMIFSLIWTVGAASLEIPKISEGDPWTVSLSSSYKTIIESGGEDSNAMCSSKYKGYGLFCSSEDGWTFNVSSSESAVIPLILSQAAAANSENEKNIPFIVRFNGSEVKIIGDNNYGAILGVGKVTSRTMKFLWFGGKPLVAEGAAVIDFTKIGGPVINSKWTAAKSVRADLVGSPSQKIAQSKEYMDSSKAYSEIDQNIRSPEAITITLTSAARTNPEAAAEAAIQALKDHPSVSNRYLQMKAGNVLTAVSLRIGSEQNFRAVTAMMNGNLVNNIRFSDTGHIEGVLNALNSLDLISWKENRDIRFSAIWQTKIKQTVAALDEIENKNPGLISLTKSIKDKLA